MQILNLGSGNDKSIKGAITIDLNINTIPHIVNDLNKIPWPFKDNTFEIIYCKDVIEHLEDIVKTLEEIHRIAKNGAKIYITIPHFSCYNSYSDPTHLHHLGLLFLDYFTGNNKWDFYTKIRFKKLKGELIFYPKLKNKLIWRIANRYPVFYEEHLAWIFPAWFMSFELEAIK